jgi:hypothetical protein
MSEIKRLVEEALLLNQLVDRAARTQQTGSFSERNPILGKMKTCPYCRVRERNHECRAKLNHPVVFGKSLVKGKRIKQRGEK